MSRVAGGIEASVLVDPSCCTVVSALRYLGSFYDRPSFCTSQFRTLLEPQSRFGDKPVKL